MALSLEQSIVDLRSKGLGRTKIARALNITEWKVRVTERRRLSGLLKEKEKGRKTTQRIRLKKIKKSKAKVTRAVVLSDIHIPYHDQGVLAIAMEYMLDYKPEHIVLNGDIVDFYTASSYRKDPLRIDTLQDEIDEVRAFLDLLREQHPKAKIDFTKGNHEARLEKFLLDKAPALSSLECLCLDELLNLEEYKINFVDEKACVRMGDLEITHGTVVRRWSGLTAKAHHEKYGGSVLVGHVHRLAAFYHTDRWGTHVALENGFLGRKDFDYVDRPDWQHGFTQVEYASSGRFSVRQHHITGGILDVDGVQYTAG